PRIILPTYMIEENDEYPYYDDTIVKYMSQPNFSEFDNITYPNYFEKYLITPHHPVQILIQSIVTTYEELYFYQQLLLKVPTRNESDYKTTLDSTYKEKFLSLFPEFLINLQNQT
ncbi:20155_t:CDS:2, partial [Gigaspora rosea]